jgi:hypothetical protein
MVKIGKPLLKLLITYSWSFLTILALFTVTVALDPFDRGVEPEVCDVDEPLIRCDEVTANTSTNTLTFDLENNDFDTLVVDNVRVESVNNANTTQRCTQTSNTLTSTNEITIICTDLPITTEMNEFTVSYYVYDARQGPRVGRPSQVFIRAQPGSPAYQA